MCLIVFSFRDHPEYPLIFAGNRDEFHGRPTEPAHFWPEVPDLLGGRDLEAGGTWLAVSRTGRFATVTNYREPSEHRPDAKSRGALVTDFILKSPSPESFLEEIEQSGAHYNGFNLIFGSVQALYYASNEADSGKKLEPGTYGLSNGRLDTPWPKVTRAKSQFQEATKGRSVDPEDLLRILADEHRPTDEQLPSTGLGRRWERLVSSIFIRADEYGTRASTVVLIDKDGEVTFVERSFARAGIETETKSFRFTIEEEIKMSQSGSYYRNGS